MSEQYQYLSGFWNHFQTEAEKGALPEGQNSPQKPPLGLYAEQLSGTSFLSPRHENLRSWLYRIRPSVLHSRFERLEHPLLKDRPFDEVELSPNQLRWNPLAIEREKGLDFIDSLVTIAGNGGLGSVRGSSVHLYAASRSMADRYFYDSDGDLLIVPEQGSLDLLTEFGRMRVSPWEIGLVPRGVKFQVHLPDGTARGYICENFGPAFRLPHLGPIGSNGLANPRDFQSPVAWYEEKTGECELVTKFEGKLWRTIIDHSPFDVVGWHGNYCP
ncbi:MAG: homogentisate 1,2-dioxygenase, partial [Cyanobacteria bacterium]|nr:homogentisate 1,2-dioxygenase [Cyanobacteriota bacterium]